MPFCAILCVCVCQWCCEKLCHSLRKLHSSFVIFFASATIAGLVLPRFVASLITRNAAVTVAEEEAEEQLQQTAAESSVAKPAKRDCCQCNGLELAHHNNNIWSNNNSYGTFMLLLLLRQVAVVPPLSAFFFSKLIHIVSTTSFGTSFLAGFLSVVFLWPLNPLRPAAPS